LRFSAEDFTTKLRFWRHPGLSGISTKHSNVFFSQHKIEREIKSHRLVKTKNHKVKQKRKARLRKLRRTQLTDRREFELFVRRFIFYIKMPDPASTWRKIPDQVRNDKETNVDRQVELSG